MMNRENSGEFHFLHKKDLKMYVPHQCGPNTRCRTCHACQACRLFLTFHTLSMYYRFHVHCIPKNPLLSLPFLRLRILSSRYIGSLPFRAVRSSMAGHAIVGRWALTRYFQHQEFVGIFVFAGLLRYMQPNHTFVVVSFHL